jgi:uncharacterized protein YutE (UPF0331/DUF86 family)
VSIDDVELNKAAIIERCLARVQEEYAGNPAHLRDDLTRQDSIVLNLQRACEASIDLAMHRVRVRGLGIPQDSRAAFELLANAGALDRSLADALNRMVGFRNIAVRGYRALNLDIVQAIVESGCEDLRRFACLAAGKA